MSGKSGPQPGYRALWSSVVLQALEDIESQPNQSAAFADAGGILVQVRGPNKLAAETLRRSTDMRYDSPLHLARLVARRRSARPRAFHIQGPRTMPPASQPRL